MSIRYAIGGKISSISSCYGGIMGDMFPCPNIYNNAYNNRPDYQASGYNSFISDKFNGITLYLSTGAWEKSFSHAECADWNKSMMLFDRRDDNYVRSMLRIARAVGFGEYIPRTIHKLKADGCIHFSPDIPFYIVVAVTGFFRAWDGNHTELHNVYSELVKKGLDPYTAFCGAQSLSLSSAGNWELYFAGEHSIVPYSIFNKNGVSAFKAWKERASKLPSMLDDLTGDDKSLDYYGRDEWFGAMFSGNGKDVEGMEEDELREACVTVSHLTNGFDVYDTNYVNIDSLIEEVKQW